MSVIEKEMTVGEMVVERPARARVFEKFGIDYCCGGKKPLAQTCREKGLELIAVLSELEKLDSSADAGQRDWSKASLGELADHIVTTHHGYLRSELPRLEFLTRKVASVHGEEHPELLQVREIFVGLKQEMDQHMAKEEQILFPMCRQLDQKGAKPAFHCG